MKIRNVIISVGCWCLLVVSSLAGDPVISEFDLDIKVLKKTVESLDDAENLTKEITRLSDRYAKAATAEKKAGVREDLDELKVELIMVEGFPDAWRRILAKALKIKDEHIVAEYPTVDEIKAMTDKDLSRLMDKNYSLSKRTDLEKQAISLFPTNGVGDTVSISVHGREVSGRINSMSGTGAMIGSTMVPLLDLPPSFHVQRMLKSRQDYVRENYTEKRLAYLKTLHEKLPPKIYRENGYIDYEGSWVPARDVIKRIEDRITELTTTAQEKEARKLALIAQAKHYGSIGGGVLGVVLVLGIMFAIKARKN